MIFSKIKKLFIDNKKILYYLWFFIIVYLMFGDFVNAGEAVTEAERVKWFVTFLNWVMWWLAALIWVMTYFVSLFLEPGWINWTIFWLYDNFKQIWILISNVVYFIFAFILIWIAFMNIIGKWEKWELKQALPKFIIWVLIVPFSWFFVQFILSISAILTAAALSLPFDTFTEYKNMYNSVKIPTECTINLKSESKTSDSSDEVNTTTPTEDKKSWMFTCIKENTVWLWDTFKSTSFWLISIYSYWILQLNEIDKINLNQIGSWEIKTIWDLVLHIIFNILFILIFMILFITLWLVIAVRWMYLWVYTMISPVFWLMYFFDKKDWWWEWALAKFNIKEFLALAFVPVYVMLALWFWLSFIFVIIHWLWGSESDVALRDSKFQITGSWIVIKWALAWGKDFKLNVEWAISNSTTEKLWAWGNFLYNIWTDWLWIVWSLILQLLWAAVLRIAIMAALRTSDITKAITQPIYDFGNQVWSLIAKSPQYAPIFGGQSMTSMSSMASTWSSYFENKSRNRWVELLWKHWLFWQTVETESKAANANSTLKSLKGDVLSSQAVSAYSEALHWFKTSQSASDSKTMVDNAQILARKLQIPEDKYKDIAWKKDNFAVLQAMIDEKLYKMWWSFWDLIKNKKFTGQDVNTFNWTALDKYLNEEKVRPTIKPEWSDQQRVIIKSLSWGGEWITGWNLTVEIKVNKVGDKYDVSSDSEIPYIAKEISSWWIEEGLFNRFTNKLQKELEKYFDKDWKYIEKWDQSKGKLPWEIK